MQPANRYRNTDIVGETVDIAQL